MAWSFQENNVCQSLAYNLQRKVLAEPILNMLILHDRNLKGGGNSNTRHMEKVNHKWQTKRATFNTFTFVDQMTTKLSFYACLSK